MKKYEELKNKYDNLVKQTLEKNKQLLIDSFVEYYGEEYRSIIEKRYSEITFVYYVDWNTIKLVVKEFVPHIKNKKEYKAFVELYNSKKLFKTIFTKKFKDKKENKSNLPEDLIGTTNTTILNKEGIRENLFDIFNRPSPVSFNFGSEINMNRIICFQILSLSEVSIIHEINHALTRDNLVFIVDKYQSPEVIHKAGLSIDYPHKKNTEIITEELINEKASQEIAKIFKEKGGDLSSFCFDIPLAYPYQYNFYLVDEFYDLFKEYIKIAKISDNKNALIGRIGKTNYEDFISFVNSCYTIDFEIIDKLKEEKLPELNKIIDKMRKNVTDSFEMSQQELNEYYEYLRAQGFKVNTNTESNDMSNSDEENKKRR